MWLSANLKICTFKNATLHTQTVVSNLNQHFNNDENSKYFCFFSTYPYYKWTATERRIFGIEKTLLESNTELIVEYHSDCIGSKFVTLGEVGDCEYKNPLYLFWIKEDKYYKRKFTNCDIFKVNEMDKSDFLESVKENLSLIEKSEILPVIHKSKKTLEGGVVEETIIETEFSHYCESKFIFHTKSDKIEKSIIDYYLDTKMIDENTPNDNYEFNEKSILNTIFKLVKNQTE